jgi:hypothetical protein
MRKIAIAVSVVVLLSACDSVDNTPRKIPTGQGTVVEVVHEPVVYYSKRDCEKKFTKAGCRIARVKTPEHWEIGYIDSGTGEEVEVDVTYQVADGCVSRLPANPKFFNGSTCQ